MLPKKVLITREIPQAGINILNIYSDRLELINKKGAPLPPSKLKKGIKGVDALITIIPDKITKEIINAAGNNLKVISAYSVGFDHIDIEHATKNNIFVGNTPSESVEAEAVAEHVMALMLSLGRQIPKADKFCRDQNYKYFDPMLFVGPRFRDKTIGIIGFGRIGQHVAKLAKGGFNMQILYNDPKTHLEAETMLDAKKVDLDTLLEHSDVISLQTPLTKYTNHLINEDDLRKMKPLAYLINTSRGSVVNEKALTKALKENWIAGAALDVFEKEPKINPELLKLDNVVLSPHIAGANWESRIHMARMAAENVVDVLINEKPPRYLVNKELAHEKISSLA